MISWDQEDRDAEFFDIGESGAWAFAEYQLSRKERIAAVVERLRMVASERDDAVGASCAADTPALSGAGAATAVSCVFG